MKEEILHDIEELCQEGIRNKPSVRKQCHALCILQMVSYKT